MVVCANARNAIVPRDFNLYAYTRSRTAEGAQRCRVRPEVREEVAMVFFYLGGLMFYH